MDSSTLTPQPIVAETLTTELVPTNASPGYKTTEFWLHLLAIIGVVSLGLVGVGLPHQVEAACLVVSAASYSIARGLAKLGNSK